MLIINPSYDAAFKCLLENNKLAKFFIGLLLETTILELEMQPQEISVVIAKEKSDLSVLRLDFKATILDEKGERKVVLIELQNTKNKADLFRFRDYLGAQYMDKGNAYHKDKEPIPIITIYFIGFSLPTHQDVPILKIERNYRDLSTKEILEGKIPFVEVLSHDMLLVQMPAIKQRRRFEIEQILSIFDYKGGIYIEVDESNYPNQGKELLTYLHNMMKDPIVVRNLEYERLLNEEIEDERQLVRQLKADLNEEKRQKKEAILNMKSKGMSILDIESIFGISEEAVKNYLSEK